VVVSVVVDEEPIDELLELGVDEELELGVDDELESLLDGVVLEPEAPIELELGLLDDDEDDDEGEVVDEEGVVVDEVDGEAPIVVLLLLAPDVAGALEPVLEGDVVLLLPVVGVLLLVPVPLPLVEPELVPAEVPALPPDVPPVWAAA
jgi:hypothetical protein